MNRKDPGNDNDDIGKKSRSQKNSKNNNANNTNINNNNKNNNNNSNYNNNNNKTNSRNKNNNLGYDMNKNIDNNKNKNKNLQAGGSGAVFTVKGLSGSSGSGYLSGKINSKNQSKKNILKSISHVATKVSAAKKNVPSPPVRNVSVNGHRIKNSRKVESV
jgi:hypothetical protein